MKASIPRRYYLIPLAYVAIIAMLVTLEFSGTVKIEERLNNLTVTAEVSARRRGDSSALQKLILDLDGFILAFERQEPLEFRLSSGRSVFAHLTGYSILPGAVEIDFGDRLKFEIRDGNDDQSRVRVEANLKESAELVIPFQYPVQGGVDEIGGLPLFEIRQQDRKPENITAVALPADSTIDLENGFFVLRNGADSFGDFYVTRLEKETTSSIAHWFSLHYQSPEPEAFDSQLESYLAGAYLGWTTTRYSVTGGTWRMPDSPPQFDEYALTAALTEALKRGTYPETSARFRSGMLLHAGETTYLSAPHLGDIVNKGRGIMSGDIDRIREVEGMVSRGDLKVFSEPCLLPFLQDRAPTSLFQNLAELAGRTDIAAADPGDAPGMLNVYLESRDIEGPLAAAFGSFRKITETSLLPAVRLTDRGYFIAATDDRIDVYNSLRAGVSLKLLGSYEDNEFLEEIGRALVSSALQLSESEGFLPAALQTDERTVIGTSGILRPEELYPLITGEAYYPKHVSLTADLGARSWAWTLAENFEARRSGSRLVISFEYPVGRTHHFLLQGIEPFSSMTFFGIPWVSDPRFQIYGSGWLYDEAGKTLYVKITHSIEREELVIAFD